jgi:hypothetical protein
MAGFNAFYAEG